MGIQIRAGKFDAELNPYIYNHRSGAGGNMAKWAIALAKMRSEGYRPKILTLGTSKNMGAGAGTAMTGAAFSTGAAAKTKTKYLGDILTARGIPCVRGLMFGNGLLSLANNAAYDTRITNATNWLLNTGIYQSIAGLMLQCSNPNVDNFPFLPEGTVDTVDVLHAVNSGNGTFTISDGATVLGAAVNANGTAAFARVSRSLSSRGSGKTINLNRTTAQTGSVFFAGIVAYDSQTPSVEIMNAGRFGGKANDITGATANAWNAFPAIPAYAPDLTVIAFAANELAAGNVTPEQFSASVQTLITQAKISGDVLLSIEIMGDTTGNAWGSVASQNAYISALYTLADLNDVCLINENGIASGKTSEGGYTVANAAGLMADGIHENARANALLANVYAKVCVA